MTKPYVDIQGLRKSYRPDFWKKTIHAVSDLNLKVHAETVYGLVGPNGAGKTTSLKCLLGFVNVNKGQVRLFGQDPWRNAEARRKVGYLPERAYYYPFLTGPEILSFYGKLFGMASNALEKRVDELLNLVGLDDRRDVKLSGYSKGMLQRIGIAQALINDPDLVILDEPMSGLDPLGRKEVKDIIRGLKTQKKTVIFCSHILSDVELLCDEVVMLAKGKVVAQGHLDEVVKPDLQAYELVVEGGEVLDFPASWQGTYQMIQEKNAVLVHINQDGSKDIQAWVNCINDQKRNILSLNPKKQSLESVLIQKINGVDSQGGSPNV